MKKRTNSYQATTPSTPQTSKTSQLSTANPQNYLHILKQTSVTNQTSKKITLKKPESLSSSLRATDLRLSTSNKVDSGLRSSKKVGGIQSAFTFTPQAQNTPLYQPLNVKNVVTRNNSEPKLKKGITEQIITSNQPSLSGSFHIPDSVPQSNQGSIGDISSPELKKTTQKNNYLIGSELVATTTSSHDKHNEHGLSSTGTNRDSQSSNQKFSAQIKLQKQVPPFTSDFLNESVEVDKSEDTESKDGDVCMNHRQKRAKYYTNCEEDPLVQYKLCSKCAVALADKGAKVREIINSEEELRSSEIEAFLIKLSHSRRNTKMIIESLAAKRQDFIEFFKKQHGKAEAIRAVLEKIIKEEFDQVTKRTETQKLKITNIFDNIEVQLNGNLKEVANMQSDIEQNLENILKNIEIKPFQKIIGAYHQRIQELDQSLDVIRAQNVSVEKLPGFKPKDVQEIKPRVQGLFELREFQTSFLKRNENEKEEGIQPVLSKKYGNGHSLGVSFENKEKFEKACNSMLDSYRMADRFSFSASQTEALRILDSGMNSKAPSQGGPDTETSNRTLKEVYPERDGQEYSEGIQTERKAGLSNRKEEKTVNAKSPSKLRYHTDSTSKPSERRSTPATLEHSLAKVTLDRGSPTHLSLGKKFGSPKGKDSKLNSLRSVRQHDREEEEISSPDYDSMIKDPDQEIEASARYNDSFEITPSNREFQDQFMRKSNSNAKLEAKNFKSQSNPKILKEYEGLFAISGQGQHKSAYCSPNFKENIDA